MADPNAKLQSLFGKKKLKNKKPTTVNANVIVKTSAQNAERAAVAAAEAVAAPKPAASGTPATGKKLSDLSLDKAGDEGEKASFQWAKQPKKYKNLDVKEAVPTTWAEREQRNRLNRRIPLDNERAFPSLGAEVDGANASLQKNMKAPTAKAVATKNAWASLHDDEDED